MMTRLTNTLKKWMRLGRPKVPRDIARLLRDLHVHERTHHAERELLKIGVPTITPLYDILAYGEPSLGKRELTVLMYIAWDHPEAVLNQLSVLLTHSDHYRFLDGGKLVHDLITHSADQPGNRGVKTLHIVLDSMDHASTSRFCELSYLFVEACWIAFPDDEKKQNKDYRAAIDGVNSEAVMKFLPLVHAPDEALRIRAVQILGCVDTGTDQVLNALRAALTDSDEKVRWNAKHSLSRLMGRKRS